MDILENLKRSGIVPVVVLDDAKDAVPTAKALLAGGIDVMEITFRTAAAADSQGSCRKLPGYAGGCRHGYHAGAVQKSRGDGEAIPNFV